MTSFGPGMAGAVPAAGIGPHLDELGRERGSELRAREGRREARSTLRSCELTHSSGAEDAWKGVVRDKAQMERG